jgi:hypothetical protein
MWGCPIDLASSHLLLRFRPLARALGLVIATRDGEAHRLYASGGRGAAISRIQVEAVLAQASDRRPIAAGTVAMTLDEVLGEKHLRDKAAALGARLPLDALALALGLDDFECEVLVLCAASELDSEYDRVFAYVHDDISRRQVSIELACALTAASFRERLERRTALSEHGRLRRLGLVTVAARETGARDEIRLTPHAVDALLGVPIDLALAFHDPASVVLAPATRVPADPHLVERAARGLAAHELGVVAIWGRTSLARDIVAAIGAHTGAGIRRYPVPGVDARSAAITASMLGALLWVDVDALGEQVPDGLVDTCRRASVPLVVTGAQPWRPTELVAARDFIEVPAVDLGHAERERLWRDHGDIADEVVDRVTSAYRFDALEVLAATRMARATAKLRTNGLAVEPSACLVEACAAVARKHGERHTTLVTPRRGPEDLVLQPELHVRVMELAHNFRALPRVMEDWGFASRVSGSGIKALFTGDPGTGKTLAAEVVASEAGLPMLKVDLARVVSKWIGETEKNLDHAFNEARESHAVLFFDEAEALFGARGEVRHGTDRYANLEVSYLLQRLEEHAGVVILATNLRDRIDPAFMRRFQAVIGFPRPGERERKRIWQRVFGPAIPLADALDVASLARLDLTGAGIVGAAQTAAFAAAREGAPLGMRHVVHGLVRQFQREARVLSPHDLGAHAVHLS